MELPRLIEALSDPAAYPHPVGEVEIRQTHISAVFLAGPFAYKIKKPVDLGFLDFSTLEKRCRYCEEEVRLNRRLAPTVYLGVIPVTRDDDGVHMGGRGEVVDWAVQMTRLPESATVQARLLRGTVGAAFIESLARTVARFHRTGDANAHIASFGRFAAVAANARENFDQAVPQVGATVHAVVFERLKALTEAELERLRPLMEDRARRGVPRDTHGDLHLDHVYYFPEREPPDDVIVIDCIEFNERFRYADPVADMAFLGMDLTFHGRRDLALAFAAAYFREAGDEEGRDLLPFYTAYRAVVRAKVEGFELVEAEIDAAERDAALVRARAHWLLALGELEGSRRRPCLLLVGGLPGTGKSTLARGLTTPVVARSPDRADCVVIRSDLVRKELTGSGATDRRSAAFAQGIYTPEWTKRTYAECLRRAERALFEGKRVVVDATFREEWTRGAFLDAAHRLAVPALLFLCEADPGVVRARLEDRRGDASDADWAVHLQAAARWEEPGPSTREAIRTLSMSGGRERALSAAVEVLRTEGLDGPS
jgi:aminoglycoside phosphotransferase family enzyme/predicted kinase